MPDALIPVELVRHLCEHRVGNVADASFISFIFQLHDDNVIAALHSFGVVTRCVRVS